jgi:hypothetical protein
MKNVFTDHPRCMGETYFQHMKCSFIFGGSMVWAGFACLLHGIFPFVFKNTGSNFLFKMTHDFVDRAPVAEDRIRRLATTLEKKIETCRN